MFPDNPLARLVVAVLGWLPLCFAIWYFAGPILLWPVTGLLKLIAQWQFADLVRSVDQSGTVFTFLTSLRPQGVAAGGAVLTVDVNGLLYAFGMPLFAALTLAAAEPRRVRTLVIGYVVLVPVVVWGVLADFLKNVAITSGPFVASQTGFTAVQREAIAFSFQFGSLILPAVIPAVAWVLTHRRFIESEIRSQLALRRLRREARKSPER